MGEIKIFFKACSEYNVQVTASFKTTEAWLNRVSLKALIGDLISITSKKLAGTDSVEVKLILNTRVSSMSYHDMSTLGSTMMSIAHACQEIIDKAKQLQAAHKDLMGAINTIQDGAEQKKAGPASDYESTSSETC